jgi:hypothetical protein
MWFYLSGSRISIGKDEWLDEYGLIEIVGANRRREYRVTDEAVTPAMTSIFQSLPCVISAEYTVVR